jgi:hypothetical protein
VRAPVFARGALAKAGQAAHHRVARHRMAGCRQIFRGIRRHLHHGHRGNRRQVVRIDHFQQVLGEHRILRVELELHACGEKRETFQQPFDVRVRALEAFHAEPAGDLRVRSRELRAHLAHVL